MTTFEDGGPLGPVLPVRTKCPFHSGITVVLNGSSKHVLRPKFRAGICVKKVPIVAEVDVDHDRFFNLPFFSVFAHLSELSLTESPTQLDFPTEAYYS